MTEISRELFDQQRRPRFGNANPERMRLAFWEWMIRGGEAPATDGESGLEKLGFRMREGKLKSAYGPYRARDQFNIPMNAEEGPIWTFDRMGATRSQLPDGRVVCVGGEHGDSYDPDFHIYNDVVVLGPYGQVEIYGYPKEMFPPTDFHTATVANDRIVVIGGLGYSNERRPGHTPVYVIDLSHFGISEITTSGEMPGWISEHESSYDPLEGVITVKGGQLVQERNRKRRIHGNFEDYALDTRSWAWRRLTSRNWREFSIRQEKGMFVLEQRPEPESLLIGFEHAIVLCEGKEDVRFLVAGTTVSLTIGIVEIKVVVQGTLSDARSARMLEEIRANAEAAIQRPCTLLQD